MSIHEDKIRSGDQFMPCLLARLTDQNPQMKTEHFPRGISVRQLKQDILRNIDLILNSRSHPGDGEMGNDRMMVDSVLGMGLRDFCGCSHSMNTRESLCGEILHQLRCFEPRIAADSLTVKLLDGVDSGGSVLAMAISGRICIAPLQEELLFHSHLDLESGIVEVKLLDERS